MGQTRGMASEAYVLEPGHAPTPFTAAEIRAATAPGLTIETVTEEGGRVVGRSRTRFVACDDEGTEIEHVALDATGDPVAEPRVARATWDELQAHASFPAAITRRTSQMVELPVGTERCLRYVVERDGARTTFWFAVDLPGQPMRWAVESSGAPPRVTTVTSIERRG